MVESVLDFLDLRSSKRRQVTRLRQVLAYEPVGVLVGTALPGRIWVRKVEIRSEVSGDIAMCGELLTVVRGDRCDVMGKSP